MRGRQDEVSPRNIGWIIGDLKVGGSVPGGRDSAYAWQSRK
jgi:hypothetical protein